MCLTLNLHKPCMCWILSAFQMENWNLKCTDLLQYNWAVEQLFNLLSDIFPRLSGYTKWWFSCCMPPWQTISGLLLYIFLFLISVFFPLRSHKWHGEPVQGGTLQWAQPAPGHCAQYGREDDRQGSVGQQAWVCSVSGWRNYRPGECLAFPLPLL